jgi:hypothetical protein
LHQFIATWRAARPETKELDLPADVETSSPDSGVGKLLVRVVLGILLVVAITVAGTLLLMAVGSVSGVLRGIIAAAMGLGIATFGIGYFRFLTNPPPPDPEPVTVDPRLRLAYVCEMCGLELAVVAVAKERAPKHCGESMVLLRRGEERFD